jgi:hypothetical protein
LNACPRLAGPDYVTLDRALDRNLVEIREKGSGEVNTVRVRNLGRSHVFGLAGDMIVGARQDRMLRNDVLIPPKSGWLDVEVYCTERGRWHATSEKFGGIERVVPAQVRTRAARTESQSEVWAGVSRMKDDLADAAPTSALQSIYADSGIDARSRGYLDELRPLPRKSSSTVGVLVAVGRRIVCLDIFAEHDLFSAMWDKLLRSYVMDALSLSGSGRLDRDEAEDFLRSLNSADLRARPTAGAGRLYRMSTTRGAGSALLFRREPVHLDLFPDTGFERGEPDEWTPRLDIRRPGR